MFNEIMAEELKELKERVASIEAKLRRLLGEKEWLAKSDLQKDFEALMEQFKDRPETVAGLMETLVKISPVDKSSRRAAALSIVDGLRKDRINVIDINSKPVGQVVCEILEALKDYPFISARLKDQLNELS